MAEKAEVLLRPNGGAAAERRVTVFTKAKGGVKAVGGFLLLNPKTFPRLEEAQPAPRPLPPPAYLPKHPPVWLFAASVTQRLEVDQSAGDGKMN